MCFFVRFWIEIFKYAQRGIVQDAWGVDIYIGTSNTSLGDACSIVRIHTYMRCTCVCLRQTAQHIPCCADEVLALLDLHIEMCVLAINCHCVELCSGIIWQDREYTSHVSLHRSRIVRNSNRFWGTAIMLRGTAIMFRGTTIMLRGPTPAHT